MITIITGEWMSKKRGMSKQQRLYYEHQNKDKIRAELVELAKQTREVEKATTSTFTFNPHQNSYYN
jgi:hypothetical protein